MRKITDDLSLSIISEKPIDKNKVKAAFRSYTEEQLDVLKTTRHRNMIRQLRLFLIGVVFILLWLFVSSKTEGVGPEVLSIIGSFAVWEATNIWLVDNPEIRVRRAFLGKLNKMNIHYEDILTSSVESSQA